MRYTVRLLFKKKLKIGKQYTKFVKKYFYNTT